MPDPKSGRSEQPVLYSLQLRDGNKRIEFQEPNIKHSVFIPYQRPTGQQADRYALIGQEVTSLGKIILGLCTDGYGMNREASLALTALEEVRLRANQAIAVHGFGKEGREHGVTVCP